MTADSRKESQELRNLRSLAKHSKGKYIVELLDEFLHYGPNGTHQCLVFELLGPSLETVLEYSFYDGESLEPEIVLKISQQLLQAIALIHEVGYAHGGMIGIQLFYQILMASPEAILLFVSVADL